MMKQDQRKVEALMAALQAMKDQVGTGPRACLGVLGKRTLKVQTYGQLHMYQNSTLLGENRALRKMHLVKADYKGNDHARM